MLTGIALALAVKIFATVLVVLGTVAAAERLGPFWGGLVGTFPSTIGPAYIFLAIESGDRFVAQSALAGTAATVTCLAFVVTIALVADRTGPLRTVLIAALAWLATAAAVRAVPLSVTVAIALNLAAFLAAVPLIRRKAATPVLAPPARARWYDLPARALLAGCFVGAVTAVSTIVGPDLTGIIAMYPIVFTTLAVILGLRYGGPLTGPTFASAVRPLMAVPVALLAIHLTAVSWGSTLALSLGLAICLGWGAILILSRPRRRAV